MSNAIISFAVIHNNPFIFGPLFPTFYGALGQKPKSILLSYLVLPLVLYPASQKFLVNATSRSSAMTLAGKRERLYGLNERILEYRELTNVSLQYAIDMGVICIGVSHSVAADSAWPLNSAGSSAHLKASNRLGNLFAPFDVPTIYRMLGVKKL